MGWTGYYGLTAQEAIAAEMRGTEIIKRSGNWIVFRNQYGHVGLTHFLTQRSRDEVFVKDVDITMGPGIVPPRAIAQAYVDLYDGDIDKAGGHYGADVLREALERRSQKDKVDIKVGNAFDLDTEGTWTDGAAMRGEYVYLGKYRARRYDGATVRLPRWWRKQATRALVAA